MPILGCRLRRLATWLGLSLVLCLATNCGTVSRRPLDAAAGSQPDAALAMQPLDSQPTVQPTVGHPVLGADGIYVPASVDPQQPAPVLLALHGMGGSGARIAARLRTCADANGWVVVAPSMKYRDYLDPQQVVADESEILPWLRDQLDDLPNRLPDVTLSDQVLVYGFSRGAQLAHRFAYFYPERVAGVAVLSGGSYTVPRPTPDASPSLARFPYGVADLQQYSGHAFQPGALSGMPFWVGVGMADAQPGDVPRDWDPLLGTTRVERGHRFAGMLRELGADVTFDQFAGVGHDDTPAMRNRACDFLASHVPLSHG